MVRRGFADDTIARPSNACPLPPEEKREMLKKNLVASLMMAMLVACTVLTASTNAQPRRARRRAQTSQVVPVLDNEAKLVKSKPKGVIVTDNEAKLNRGRRRARTPQSMSQQSASAAVDNTIADGPQRVKAKKPGHFLGSSDDGQSIRKKQPHGRRGRH